MIWKTAFTLGRVSNLPTVWTNVLAAAIISRKTASLSFSLTDWPLLLVACFSISLLYIGGMYLNDAYDRNIDAVEKPSRPIPSGKVSAKTVFIVGYLLLISGMFGLSLTAFFHGSVLVGPLFALLLGAAIVFYDMRHKKNRFGPVVMGLCRALVYASVAFALTKVTLFHQPGLWLAPLALWCYIIGLSYIARQENLSKVKNLWPLLFLFTPLCFALYFLLFMDIHIFRAINVYSVVSLMVALAAVVVYSFLKLRKPEKVGISQAVSVMIAGICLLDALVLALYGQSYAVAVGAAGFLLTLLFQHFIPGT
ncbi:MAG: UbiA family prenyltransferase [Leptospirales bacterium]